MADRSQATSGSASDSQSQDTHLQLLNQIRQRQDHEKQLGPVADHINIDLLKLSFPDSRKQAQWELLNTIKGLNYLDLHKMEHIYQDHFHRDLPKTIKADSHITAPVKQAILDSSYRAPTLEDLRQTGVDRVLASKEAQLTAVADQIKDKLSQVESSSYGRGGYPFWLDYGGEEGYSLPTVNVNSAAVEKDLKTLLNPLSDRELTAMRGLYLEKYRSDFVPSVDANSSFSDDFKKYIHSKYDSNSLTK